MSHESAPSHHVAVDSAEEKLSRALRSLPARIPPEGLTVALRVIASRERQRFLERSSLRRMIAAWHARASLSAGEMMRSMVLPLAGGVCTAVVLFSTWLVPTYPLHAAGGGFDVPTMLSTEASVTTQAGAIGLSRGLHEAIGGGDAVVDVILDYQGSVVDYAVVSGTEVFQDAGRRHQLENLLLRTQFAPATEFGRPVASRVRLISSQIDVKD
jgi:hypothetical protein